MKKSIQFAGIVYVTKPKMDEATSVVLLALKRFAEKQGLTCSADITSFPTDEMLLIVSIGGDGTMLGAMRKALNHPDSIVFGINTGTLGFLSEEVATENIGVVLTNIINRVGLIEERMALSGSISIDGETINDDMVAVNELSMVPMTLQRPLTINIDINKQHISSVNGSGVIVATSTGSTAMALSGGGAIVSPSTNIMQIVPIMPHTLTSRPIITTGRDFITLSADIVNIQQPIEIYSDGNFLYTITNDANKSLSVTIRKHQNKIKVYRPLNWNFFNVLSEKMKW